MRLLPALILIVPAFSLIGCATQQNLDTQANSIARQLDAMKQSQSSMADAQKNLEARLGKLESEQALLATRLNHGDTALKGQLDTLRGHVAATQQELATLTSKVDAQANGIPKRSPRRMMRSRLPATAASSAARLSTSWC